MFKDVIKKVLGELGLEIRRVHKKVKPTGLDLFLYERYPRESREEKRFYNVGAGSFKHPFWTRIDLAKYRDQEGTDIEFDLMANSSLPLKNNFAEVFYTSHTIEHINNEAVSNLFSEVHRILKKDGVFRVTAPNIDLDYQAYLNNDVDYFPGYYAYSIKENYEGIGYSKPMNEESIEQIFLEHVATSLSRFPVDGEKERLNDREFAEMLGKDGLEKTLDYCVSRCSLDVQRRNPHYHMNWWNPTKTIRFLRNVGFEKVFVSAYGQSTLPILRNTDFFDSTGPKISFYIEAIK